MFRDSQVAVAADFSTPDFTPQALPRARRQRAARLPVVQDTPASPYAVGPLRAATDAEHARLVAFNEKYPGFARALGHEGLLQIAAGYLDDDDLATRGDLRRSGVSIGWRRPESDDVNPTWSDDQ